jgi:hypothetical protein
VETFSISELKTRTFDVLKGVKETDALGIHLDSVGCAIWIEWR